MGGRYRLDIKNCNLQPNDLGADNTLHFKLDHDLTNLLATFHKSATGTAFHQQHLLQWYLQIQQVAYFSSLFTKQLRLNFFFYLDSK